MAKTKTNKKESSSTQNEGLLTTLKARFEENMNRHKGLVWDKVQAKLEANPGKLRSLGEMESTGGEPDVIGFDKKTGEFIFCDCSPETLRQRGTRFLPGLNTGVGKDDTIFATITGHVQFANQTRLKKKINILPVETK